VSNHGNFFLRASNLGYSDPPYPLSGEHLSIAVSSMNLITIVFAVSKKFLKVTGPPLQGWFEWLSSGNGLN